MSGTTSGSGSDVLREFLVAVRYEERGREKLVKDLENIGKEIIKFAAAIEGAAVAAVAAISKIASQFEDLYFASQRMGASIENIRSLSYAMTQMGGSAEGARQALEGLSHFLRSNPGSEQFLHSMGIATRSAGGQMRDTSALMQDLASRWKRMPFYQAQAEAGIFGIDERTLMTLMRGTTGFAEQLKALYQSVGLNSEKAGEASHKFMTQLRFLGATLDVVKEKVMTDLAGRVGDVIGRFQKKIVANFGDISKAIEWFVVKLLIGADMIERLVSRGIEAVGELVKWFNNLDGDSKKLLTTLTGMAAVFALLEFPALAITALATSIALLYEDWKTWREHGTSLIDWDKWQPAITATIEAVGRIKTAFLELMHQVIDPLHGPAGEPILEWFRKKLPDAIETGAAAITKHLFPAILALVHMGDAMGKGDIHGMLRAAAELNKALGIGSNSDGPTEEEKKQGETEGTTVIGRAWRRWAPTWAGGGTPNQVENPNKTGRSPEKESQAAFQAYTFWRGKGLDHDAAMAMVSQEIQESGGDPGARGDSGEGHGLFQHHSDRRAVILKKTGINMSTATADEQREGAYQEMSRGLDAGAGAAWRILNDPHASRYDKFRAGTKLFERPADKQGNEIATRMGIGARHDALGRSIVTTPRVSAPVAPVVPQTVNPNGPDMLFKLGSASGVTNNSPAFHQTLHIAIHGGGSDVADQVQSGVRNANQNAIRHLSTALT